MPPAQRTQIVNNIRKNSMSAGALPSSAGTGPSADWGRRGAGAPPMTSSPPGMAAPLPRVDEYQNGARRPSGPPGTPGAPGMPQGPPPHAAASPRPHPGQHNAGPYPSGAAPPHSQQRYGAGPGPASSPRPAGTPPMRRHGGPGSQPRRDESPAGRPPSQQQQQQAPPSRPATTGPKTFAEMGIATQKLEDDSNCVIM